MEKLKTDLVSCPICYEIPENEIYQCRNGHGICKICVSKSSKCPQCREQFSSETLVRNRPLEAILDAMSFDCPQKSKGCQERLQRSKITTHSQSCHYNLTGVKFSENISGGLQPGAKIQITGKPMQRADRFRIDICETATDGRILLHFEPRFAEAFLKPDADVVVRNTHFNGGWGHEERHSSSSFPFLRNTPFKVSIWCELDQFHIAVCGKSFADYKYRLPIELGKFLRISGAVQIDRVIVSN